MKALIPRGLTGGPNCFGLLNGLMTLIICGSLREIGEMACVTSAWSSRGQTLNCLDSSICHTAPSDLTQWWKFPGFHVDQNKNKNKRNILGCFDCGIIRSLIAQVNSLTRYDTSCTVKGVGSYHSSLVRLLTDRHRVSLTCNHKHSMPKV